MLKYGLQHPIGVSGSVDEMFSLSDLDHPSQAVPGTAGQLNQSLQSFSTLPCQSGHHRALPRVLGPDMLHALPSAILPPTTSQPASSSASFNDQLHKTMQHFPTSQHHQSTSSSLHVHVPFAENKENQTAMWHQFSNAATPVVMPLQQQHGQQQPVQQTSQHYNQHHHGQQTRHHQSTFSVDSLSHHPQASIVHNNTAIGNNTNNHTNNHSSMNNSNTQPTGPQLQDRLQRDVQQQHQHKLYEHVLKQELEQAKYSALEHSLFTEEKLRQELSDQKKHFEDLLAEREASCNKQIAEKEQHIQSLQQMLNTKQLESRAALQQKDQEYIALMQQQEDKFNTQYQQLRQQHTEQLQKIQQQLTKDEEFRKLTELARVEAKERSVVEVYEKKLKKFSKKVDQVVKEYHEKELKLQGALEEARRELVHVSATFDARESLSREELILKDKKLIHIQQRLDSVDEIDQMAKTWRDSVKDLASMVIRTCASVEELPVELWSSTTPGLFTSVWDDLQKQRPSAAQEDTRQSYARKRQECVIANRNLLAKCLKYSKMVHERIKAEIPNNANPML